MNFLLIIAFLIPGLSPAQSHGRTKFSLDFGWKFQLEPQLRAGGLTLCSGSMLNESFPIDLKGDQCNGMYACQPVYRLCPLPAL